MRVAILLFILALVSQTALSQIEKGAFLVDLRGQTGYDPADELVIPRIYSKIGYFPTEFLALGVRIGGYGNLVNSDNFGSVLYSGFGRYYVNPQSEKYHFYGELEAGLIVNYRERMDSEKRPIIKPGAGVTFLPGTGVALDFGLSLAFIENPNIGEIQYNNFSMQFGWKAMISEMTKETMEEAELFFGKGMVSLSGSFNLNSDFILRVGVLEPVSDIGYNSESVGFNSLTDSRSSIFSTNFSVGFFLSNRFMFDLGLGVTNFGQTDIQAGSTLFAITPRLRYYIPFGEGRTSLYLHGGYEFGGLNLDGLGTEFTYQYPHGGLGLNFMLTPGAALELGVDYGQLSPDMEGIAIDIVKFNYGVRVFL